jgi:hypothetical protein
VEKDEIDREDRKILATLCIQAGRWVGMEGMQGHRREFLRSQWLSDLVKASKHHNQPRFYRVKILPTRFFKRVIPEVDESKREEG